MQVCIVNLDKYMSRKDKSLKKVDFGKWIWLEYTSEYTASEVLETVGESPIHGYEVYDLDLQWEDVIDWAQGFINMAVNGKIVY